MANFSSAFGVLLASRYEVAQQLAPIIKTNQGRIHILPAEPLREAGIRAFGSADLAARALAFHTRGDVYLNDADSPARTALHLLHEGLHALGKGELDTWSHTLSMAMTDGLRQELSGAESEFLFQMRERVKYFDRDPVDALRSQLQSLYADELLGDLPKYWDQHVSLPTPTFPGLVD